ncbi:Serine/threonine kinase [Coemansia sp. Benny D115]|nr:Serine/threonine kinase [Coemansia sp. Benny D115]
MGNTTAKPASASAAGPTAVGHEKQFSNTQHTTEIGLHNYELLQVIGEGAFGKVRVVEHRNTGQRFALKYINKAGCVARRGEANIQRERDILELLVDHPFICSLRGSFQDSDTLYLLMDLKHAGDLRRHMRLHKIFPEATVRFWVAELACALHSLHVVHGVVHRDVKPENILLDSAGHLCLTDFNAAAFCTPAGQGSSLATMGVTGTTSYMAPELLGGKGYSFSVDWWALGVVMYECLYGHRPFRRQDYGGCREQLRVAISQASTIVLPATTSTGVCLSQESRDVLNALLGTDPGQRIGFEALMQMPFFADIDWRQLAARRISPVYVPKPVNLSVHDIAGGRQENARPSTDDIGGEAHQGAAEPRLSGSRAMRSLCRGFRSYSYAEFHSFRQYLAEHGRIAASDRLDVYLAQLYLDGRPLGTEASEPAAEGEKEAALDGHAGDHRDEGRRVHRNFMYASVAAGAAGLAHVLGASSSGSDIDSAGVRRRSTLGGRLRDRARNSWRLRPRASEETVKKEESHKEASDSSEDEASDNDISCKLPPPGVPIDGATWSLLLPGQKKMARRFCDKISADQRISAELHRITRPKAVAKTPEQPAKPQKPVNSASDGDCDKNGSSNGNDNSRPVPVLSSPSSAPALKQPRASLPPIARVRQRPSQMLGRSSIVTQASASTLVGSKSINGGGPLSPGAQQHHMGFPGNSVPRLAPIAAGWMPRLSTRDGAAREAGAATADSFTSGSASCSMPTTPVAGNHNG